MLIPSVMLPAEFVAGAWKTAGLDGCAGFVDAREPRFKRFANVSTLPTANVSLSLVASGRTLFLEVVDATWIDPGDQIEVWLAPGVASTDNWLGSCVDEAGDPAPRQWLIRAANGRVSAGHGEPSPRDLRVEVADGPRTARGAAKRFKIELPPGLDRIAVVYDDVEAAGGPAKMIPTSTFRPGVGASLGRLERVDPLDAACVLGPDGALRTVSARAPEAGRAFVSVP
jgi:hypothetical protein